VKNNSPLGKFILIASLGAHADATNIVKTLHEVLAAFQLPASHRQLKNITALRSLRLCGEFNFKPWLISLKI